MIPVNDWRVDFDERYPIFRQVANHFSRSLVKRELYPGDRIPSIRELSMALKVNTNTIQRAYQEMERDKLIYSQRGTGYFVMEDERIVERIKKTMVSETMSHFLEEMRALGFCNAEILSELKSHLREGDDKLDANDD